MKPLSIEEIEACINFLDRNSRLASCDLKSLLHTARLAHKMKEALEYYSDLGIIYSYPEDWDCFKQGGHPTIEDFERVQCAGEIANNALKLWNEEE